MNTNIYDWRDKTILIAEDEYVNFRLLEIMLSKTNAKILHGENGQETLEIFAPLVNRLGIWQIKWELEDLGFRYTNPEKYKEIAEQLAVRRESREAEIQKITGYSPDWLPYLCSSPSLARSFAYLSALCPWRRRLCREPR